MKQLLFILLFPIILHGQDELNKYRYFTELVSVPNNAGGGDGLISVVSGTNAANSNGSVTSANQIGVVTAETGTTTTGRAAGKSSSTACAFGEGPWVFEVKITNISALCSATEGYALLIGFFDVNTAANQTDGIYFLYDSLGVSTSSASSDRWQTVTAQGGTRTFTETSVDVTTAAVTANKFRIEINAGATSVDFYIDDALVRTETANIPLGSGELSGFGYMIIKSAGSTTRSVSIDYILTECIFNSKK